MTISARDNFATTSANVGITSNVALLRVRTNSATSVVIDGRAFALASTDDLWVLAGTALAVQQTCAFFLFLSITGVATVEQSAIVAASTAPTGYVAGAWAWPDPSARACVGAVVIRSGAAVFTPNTTVLTGVGTYINAALDYGKPITF